MNASLLLRCSFFAALLVLLAAPASAQDQDNNICNAQGGSEIWIENARDTTNTIIEPDSFVFWIERADGTPVLNQSGSIRTTVNESDRSNYNECDPIVGLKDESQGNVDVDYVNLGSDIYNIHIEFKDVSYVLGYAFLSNPVNPGQPYAPAFIPWRYATSPNLGPTDFKVRITDAGIEVEIIGVSNANLSDYGDAWAWPLNAKTILDAPGVSSILPDWDNMFLNMGGVTETNGFYEFETDLDVTIPDGIEATLDSMTIRFASGHKVVVEEGLNSTSTTFTASAPASGWGGIRFEPGSSGTIENGTIEYAKTQPYNPAYAVSVTDASPTIRNNNIRFNTNAAYVSGQSSLPRFEGNEVFENGQGIILANRGRADIRDNTIFDNSGDAVSGGYLTSAYLYFNTLDNNTGAGVKATSGATPTFARFNSGSNGYNVVQDNDAGGIRADGGASVGAGTGTYKGLNELFDNGSTAAASRWFDGVGPDAYAIGNGTVAYARKNWWGRPTNPDTTTCSLASCGAYTGTLYVDPMLTSAPSPPFNLGGNSKTGGAGSRAALGAGDLTMESGSSSLLSETVSEPLLAALTGEPAEALAHLQSIVATTPDHRLAAVALLEAARLAAREGSRESEPPGLPAFLQASTATPDATRRAWARRARVVYHDLRGETDEALTQATALAGETGEAAWFGHEARVYLLADAGRWDEAADALAALEAGAPDRAGTEHARRFLAFSGVETTASAPEQRQNSKAGSRDASEAGPALEAAYPNPAGAQGVTVPFSLGGTARVEVTVYDALGREVARIADGRYDAGTHEARLDTDALPGGTYLVRAVFEGDDAQQTTQTRRLTVLR